MAEGMRGQAGDSRQRAEKIDVEKAKADRAVWDLVPGHDLIPEVDLPIFHSLFLDGTHCVPPRTPLYMNFWEGFVGHGTKYNNYELSLPTCWGWEWRYKDGAYYVSFNPVRDEGIKSQREAVFREKIRPFIEDFDGIWGKWKEELSARIAQLKATMKIERAGGLKSFRPIEELVRGLTTLSNVDLLHLHWDFVAANHRMGEIHFLGLQTCYSAWILLEQMTKKRFGITDKQPEFQDMMRGFSHKVYDVDEELWGFANLAQEMGLRNVFFENEAAAVIPQLMQTAKGKGWLEKLGDFLDVEGWRMPTLLDFVEACWIESPVTVIGIIKSMMGSDFNLREKRKGLAAKRQAAVDAMLGRVSEGEKELWRGMITLAQKAGIFSEEHNYYIEMLHHALYRMGYKEMGRRLAQAGTVDQPDDILMMNLDEIEAVLINPEINDLRWITKRRRAAYEEWLNNSKGGEWRTPVYTDRPGGLMEAVEKDMLPSLDPIAIKVIIGEFPEKKPEELKADLVGLCGSPGVAEGIAFVANSENEADKMEKGQILVCPATAAPWIPIFNRVSACVTDRGGTLSHAAVVGREYGIPVVINTFVATTTIKTGQRIRVDANIGAVYILDK